MKPGALWICIDVADVDAIDVNGVAVERIVQEACDTLRTRIARQARTEVSEAKYLVIANADAQKLADPKAWQDADDR